MKSFQIVTCTSKRLSFYTQTSPVIRKQNTRQRLGSAREAGIILVFTNLVSPIRIPIRKLKYFFEETVSAIS